MMSEGADNIGKVSVLVEKDFLGNVDLTFEIHTHIIFYMTLRKIKSSFLHSLPHFPHFFIALAMKTGRKCFYFTQC